MSRKRLNRLLGCVLVMAMVLGLMPGAFAVTGTEASTPAQVSEAELATFEGIKSALTYEGMVGFEGENRLPDDDTPVSVIVLFQNLPAQTAVVQAAAEGVRLNAANAKADALADHQLFKQELDTLFGTNASARSRTAAPYEITREYHAALNGVSVTLPASSVADMVGFESVYAIYPDQKVYAEPIVRGGTGTYGNKEGGATGRAAMDVDTLHGLEITGKGVDVCVIDTGVDYNHPDLKDAFGTGTVATTSDDLIGGVFYGRNFINDEYTQRANNDPLEATYAEYQASGAAEHDPITGESFYTYHGTHVSGTIVGQDAAAETSALGVAPDATLYVYRVFGAYSIATTSSILSAIEMVDTDKPDVVNMSLGATTPDPYHLYSVAANNIILNNPEIVFAVSAGNSGEGGLLTLGSPGSSPSVITVGNASPERTRVGVNVTIRRRSATSSSNPKYTYYTMYPFYLPQEEWYTVTGAVNQNGDSIVSILGLTPGEPGDVVGGSPYSLLNMPNVSKVETELFDTIGVGTEEDFEALAGGLAPDHPDNPIRGNAILVRRGNDFLDTMQRAKEYGASAIIMYNRSPWAGNGITEGLEYLRGVSEEYLPFYVVLDYNDGVNIDNDINSAYRSYSGGKFDLTGPVETFIPAALEASSSNGPVGLTYDIKPDVVSDGANVLSTVPILSETGTYADAYMSAGGTSMSSPHVAGVAALMRQYSNDNALNWSAEEIKLRMMNTAQLLPKVGTSVWDMQDIGVYRQGAGFVNAYDAIYTDTVVAVELDNNGLYNAQTGSFASYDSGAFSFGWVDAESSEEIVRTLTARITNNSDAPITYNISYEDTYVNNTTLRYVSAAAGYSGWYPPSYTLSQNSITVPAGGTGEFTVTLTVPVDLDFQFIGSIEGYLTITGGAKEIKLPVAAYSRIAAPPLKDGEFFVNRPVISSGGSKQSPYSGDLDLLIRLNNHAVFYAYVLDYEKSRAAANPDGTVDLERIFADRAIIGNTGFAVDMIDYGDIGEWYPLNDVVVGGSYTEVVGYDDFGSPTTLGGTAFFREGPATIMLYTLTAENEVNAYYIDFYVDNTAPTLTVDGLDTEGDYSSYLAEDGASTVLTGNVYDESVDILKSMGLGYRIWEENDPFPSEPDQGFTTLWGYAGGEYTQAVVDPATGDFTLTMPAGTIPADVALYAIDGFSLKGFSYYRDISLADGFDPTIASLGDYCRNTLGLTNSLYGFVGSNLTTLNLRFEDGLPAFTVSTDRVDMFVSESKSVTVSFNGAAKRAGEHIVSATVGDEALVQVALDGGTVTLTGIYEGSTELTIATANGEVIEIPVYVMLNPGHGVVLPTGSHINLGSMKHLGQFTSKVAGDGAFDPDIQVYEGDEAAILWQVMGNEVLADGTTGALHIFSEYILDAIRFGARGDGVNHFNDGSDFNPHHWLNGGYAYSDADGNVMNGNYIESYFFKNFSDAELNAIPTVDNKVSAISIYNGEASSWRDEVAHDGKFFLPWVVIDTVGYTSTFGVYWSINDGLDARNALVMGLEMDGFGSVPSDETAATFRNGTGHTYWTETPSEGDVRLYVVEPTGALSMMTTNTEFKGVRPGATLDLTKIVYAELDEVNADRVDGDVYKLTVLGGTAAFTGDITSALLRELNAGDQLTVSGDVTGDYDQLMYKIVNSRNEIVGYGTMEAEESAEEVAFTIDTAELISGTYKIYVWPQETGTLRSNVAGVVSVLNVKVNGYTTASLRATQAQYYAGDVPTFIASLANVENEINYIDLTFEVTSDTLRGKTATALSGFLTREDIAWTHLGGDLWQGRIVLEFHGGALTQDADVLELVFDSTGKLGTASVEITSVILQGLLPDGQYVVLGSGLDHASVSVPVVARPIVYSKYDLNKDGIVNSLDLGILLFYVQRSSTDADWNTYWKVKDIHGDPIYASHCDVDGSGTTGDGVIDMADLIDMMLNYTH